jgi:hypothetical protein
MCTKNKKLEMAQLLGWQLLTQIPTNNFHKFLQERDLALNPSKTHSFLHHHDKSCLHKHTCQLLDHTLRRLNKNKVDTVPAMMELEKNGADVIELGG